MFKNTGSGFNRLLLAGYGILSFLMFLYSYTQVDLNLTLSRAGLFQSIQKFFQNIGYFNRPISVVIFLVLIFLFFGFYLVILRYSQKNKLTKNSLFSLIKLITILLFFSYPAAFSYDYFNYLFTAKTIVVYGMNPYQVTPLALAGVDPWVNFMRWTHLTSAYSPFWIGLTIPLYLLGLNIFLLTLFTFKLIFAGSYLITAWLIYRITGKIDPKNAIFCTVIYAFNPLVIIETLVSPHNDAVMMVLAVLAYYLYLQKRENLSVFALGLSGALKTMTLFMFPAVFFKWNRKLVFLLMVLATIVGFARKELLPWYLLWVVPFAAIIQPGWEIIMYLIAVSLGLLLRYAPYIYQGDYNDPVNLWRNLLFWTPVTLVFVYSIIRRVTYNLRNKIVI